MAQNPKPNRQQGVRGMPVPPSLSQPPVEDLSDTLPPEAEDVLGDELLEGDEEEAAGIQPPPPAKPGEQGLRDSERAVVTRVKGVLVVAADQGYFDGHRRMPGEKFMIPNMKKFGKWMELADPVAEAKRKKEIEIKRREMLAAAKREAAGE